MATDPDMNRSTRGQATPVEPLKERAASVSLELPSLNYIRATTFTLEAPDGVSISVHRWLPGKPIKAVVQIAHGWAEHAGPYAPLAEALCREDARHRLASPFGSRRSLSKI